MMVRIRSQVSRSYVLGCGPVVVGCQTQRLESSWAPELDKQFILNYPHVMSLAAASESRKERLEALRRRKEDGDKDGYVFWTAPSQNFCPFEVRTILRTHLLHRKPFAFKPRNYDPATRTMKKRALGEEEEDTVEKAVEGLADRIIAEDEERRAQDLVCSHFDTPILNIFQYHAY